MGCCSAGLKGQKHQKSASGFSPDESFREKMLVFSVMIRNVKVRDVTLPSVQNNSFVQWLLRAL